MSYCDGELPAQADLGVHGRFGDVDVCLVCVCSPPPRLQQPTPPDSAALLCAAAELKAVWTRTVLLVQEMSANVLRQRDASRGGKADVDDEEAHGKVVMPGMAEAELLDNGKSLKNLIAVVQLHVSVMVLRQRIRPRGVEKRGDAHVCCCVCGLYLFCVKVILFF